MKDIQQLIKKNSQDGKYEDILPKTFTDAVSCWFWDSRNLNELADRDDFKTITSRINGGYNGLSDRLMFLTRAKAELIK